MFLEVAVESDGGWIGTIWLPEGRKGWGWLRLVSEMRRMLVFQGGQIGPSVGSGFGSGFGSGRDSSFGSGFGLGACFYWSADDVRG
jgi:hypothetical protein